MNGFLKKAGLGAALAATALVAAAPADAQRWGGYRHYGHGYRGGDAGAAALGGGIVRPGIGAAIASNNRPYGFFDRGYYGPPPAYYYEPPYYPPRWEGLRRGPHLGRDGPVRVCR